MGEAFLSLAARERADILRTAAGQYDIRIGDDGETLRFTYLSAVEDPHDYVRSDDVVARLESSPSPWTLSWRRRPRPLSAAWTRPSPVGAVGRRVRPQSSPRSGPARCLQHSGNVVVTRVIRTHHFFRRSTHETGIGTAYRRLIWV